MKGIYWQKGDTLDYTPKEAVDYGQVVDLTTRIGVAASDIAAGEQGQLHVSGVFQLDKDGSEIALGAALYYDKSRDQITTTAEGHTPAGYAAAPAAAGTGTVLVKLLG